MTGPRLTFAVARGSSGPNWKNCDQFAAIKKPSGEKTGLEALKATPKPGTMALA